MFSICKSSFPASILEKSRISFTIPNNMGWLINGNHMFFLDFQFSFQQ
jgi:hypothetical protein